MLEDLLGPPIDSAASGKNGKYCKHLELTLAI